MAPDVIFVYSSLRSGTTLLRLMIDGHPALTCPDEMDFLFDYVQPDGSGGWTVDRDSLAQDRIFKAQGLPLPDTLDGQEMTRQLLAAIAGRATGTPVIMIHRGLESAISHFPEARIIHLLRDPRDVAHSSIGMGWAQSVYFGVDHWLATEREWDDTAEQIQAPVYTTQYETLVSHAQATLSEICAFLGLTYDPAMLTYPETTTYSAPDTSLGFQWKTKRTDMEIRLVENKVGPLLEAKGYAPSGLPPLHLGNADIARLKLRNRLAVLRKRIDTYGIRNVLSDTIGRRLGLERLRRSAQDEMDAITTANLK